MDSLNQPIPHTNLIASPYQAGESVSFAIADFDGKYKLNLQADVDYKIEITSMGYSSKIDSLRISKNTTKNRSEEHTSELQSRGHLVCRLLLEKKKQKI